MKLTFSFLLAVVLLVLVPESSHAFAATGSKMISPVPGSTLSGSSVTFTWTEGTGLNKYDIWIGNAPNTGDIYDRPDGPGLSQLVTGLPTDGRTLYVKLTSSDGTENNAFFENYTYVAASQCTAAPNPVSLNASPSDTGGRINLSWPAAGGCTTGYYVYYDIVNNVGHPVKGQRASDGVVQVGNVTSYALGSGLSLTPGTLYYIWLFSYGPGDSQSVGFASANSLAGSSAVPPATSPTVPPNTVASPTPFTAATAPTVSPTQTTLVVPARTPSGAAVGGGGVGRVSNSTQTNTQPGTERGVGKVQNEADESDAQSLSSDLRLWIICAIALVGFALAARWALGRFATRR